jgi:hypothetical protein
VVVINLFRETLLNSSAVNYADKPIFCYEICIMKQATLSLNLNVKKTCKQVFLEQMEHVVPWAELVELIAP